MPLILLLLFCFILPRFAFAWDSHEHVYLGNVIRGPHKYLTLESHERDFPERNLDMAVWRREWRELYEKGSAEQKRMLKEGLEYGEIVALSGDLYQNYDAFNNAPLREIYELLPLIRESRSSNGDFDKLTGVRHTALAEKNDQHFSVAKPNRSNKETWRQFQLDALRAVQESKIEKAWILSAMGMHYLTDAFAGGHLRVPRSWLLDNVVFNIASKEWHDLDGIYGVEVEAESKRWVAYGDGQLFANKNQANRQKMLEAAQTSLAHLEAAIREGRAVVIPKPNVIFPTESKFPRAWQDLDTSRWGEADDFAQVRKKTPGLWERLRILPRFIYHLYKEQGVLLVKEAPAAVLGKVNGDELIRKWIKHHDVAAIGRLLWDEKSRMILRLLDGWVSNEDVEAIEKICGSVGNKGEMELIRSKANKVAKRLFFEKVRQRVQAALEREPATK